MFGSSRINVWLCSWRRPFSFHFQFKSFKQRSTFQLNSYHPRKLHTKMVSLNPEAAAAAAPTAASSSPATALQFYRRPLPDSCIDFSSPEGKMLFRNALDAGTMERFFKMAAQFRTQDEPAFCGPSTLVMCLNALEIDPGRVWKGPWRWYHEEMLDCCVPMDAIRKEGITLDEFVCLASCNGLKVECTRVNEAADIITFRTLVEDNARTEEDIIVVSYSRQVLGQTGDGHFAPLAGYNREHDVVLIMDAARFKYPPHWVKLEDLWKAMKAVDNVSRKSRGYVLLRKHVSESSLLVFKINTSFSQLMWNNSNKGISTIKSIVNILQAFDAWLAMNRDPDQTQLLCEALKFLKSTLESTTHGNEDQFILTTQKNFADNNAGFHVNLVQTIVAALRSLPEYAEATKLFGVSSTQQPVDWCKKSNESVDLTALYIMFVLSWPNKYDGNTNGGELSRQVTRILKDVPECLQSEVRLLKQQLSSVYGRFLKCHCGDKCKIEK